MIPMSIAFVCRILNMIHPAHHWKSSVNVKRIRGLESPCVEVGTAVLLMVVWFHSDVSVDNNHSGYRADHDHDWCITDDLVHLDQSWVLDDWGWGFHQYDGIRDYCGEHDPAFWNNTYNCVSCRRYSFDSQRDDHSSWHEEGLSCGCNAVFQLPLRIRIQPIEFHCVFQ